MRRTLNSWFLSHGGEFSTLAACHKSSSLNISSSLSRPKFLRNNAQRVFDFFDGPLRSWLAPPSLEIPGLASFSNPSPSLWLETDQILINWHSGGISILTRASRGQIVYPVELPFLLRRRRESSSGVRGGGARPQKSQLAHFYIM